MPDTIASALTALRERLDEASAGEWDNPQLRRWLYEGAKDVARRGHCVLDRFNVAITAGVTELSLTPSTTLTSIFSALSDITAGLILQIDRIEWLPGDGRKVPLTPRPYNALDSVWWSTQDTSFSDPTYYTTYGQPPYLLLKLYPGPSVTSSLRLFVARLPQPFSLAGTDDATRNIDVPEGWQDLVYDYATYRALLKDRNALWKDHFALYEQKVADIISLLDYTNAPDEILFDSPYPIDPWIWA